MTLYNVIADDYDGAPQGNNLYVRAASPQDAIRMWQAYYHEEGALPLAVDEIPSAPRRGAIPWNKVLEVYRNS